VPSFAGVTEAPVATAAALMLVHTAPEAGAVPVTDEGGNEEGMPPTPINRLWSNARLRESSCSSITLLVSFLQLLMLEVLSLPLIFVLALSASSVVLQ